MSDSDKNLMYNCKSTENLFLTDNDSDELCNELNVLSNKCNVSFQSQYAYIDGECCSINEYKSNKKMRNSQKKLKKKLL